MGIIIEKKYQKTPLGAVVEDSMTSGSTVNAPSINAVQSAFSNPNLLINGDFRINQRGLTTYTSDNQTRFYTVDRWRAYGTGNSTIVKNSDGTITITSLGELWVVQPFEETLKEDDYTISCEVVSVTGDVKMWFEGDDALVYNKSLVVGVNTYTRKVSPQGATFGLIGNGASVTLKWVKLEKGSIATPFVPRPLAEELAMCQRYYETTELDSCGTANFRRCDATRTGCDSGAWRFNAEKRTYPTVTISGTPTYTNCSDLQALSISKNGCRLCVTTNATTASYYRVYGEVIIIADAEIY